MTQKVLGIDPGLASTGWGIIETHQRGHKHLDHGTILTPSSDSTEQRLLALYREIKALIIAYRPSAMGIETLFFAKNVSSAFPVAQGRGVILLAAAEAGIAVGEYAPVVIKKSVVGSGSADKKQVQEMLGFLLGLDKPSLSNHASDALAVAITYSHHRNIWSTASAVL